MGLEVGYHRTAVGIQQARQRVRLGREVGHGLRHDTQPRKRPCRLRRRQCLVGQSLRLPASSTGSRWARKSRRSPRSRVCSSWRLASPIGRLASSNGAKSPFEAMLSAGTGSGRHSGRSRVRGPAELAHPAIQQTTEVLQLRLGEGFRTEPRHVAFQARETTLNRATTLGSKRALPPLVPQRAVLEGDRDDEIPQRLTRVGLNREGDYGRGDLGLDCLRGESDFRGFSRARTSAMVWASDVVA